MPRKESRPGLSRAASFEISAPRNSKCISDEEDRAPCCHWGAFNKVLTAWLFKAKVFSLCWREGQTMREHLQQYRDWRTVDSLVLWGDFSGKLISLCMKLSSLWNKCKPLKPSPNHLTKHSFELPYGIQLEQFYQRFFWADYTGLILGLWFVEH